MINLHKIFINCS